VKIIVNPAKSLLTGEEAHLRAVYDHFSFKDKAAINELHRFKKSLFARERAIYAKHGEIPDSYIQWKSEHLKNLNSAIHVHVCEFKDGNLEIPTGLLSSLIELCKEKLIHLEIEDQRNFELSRRLLNGQKPSKLRTPQENALRILMDQNRPIETKGLGLIRLATGCGKTLLAQELIRHFGCKSIFLVPSLPILKQTVKRFESAYGAKNVKAYGGGKKTVGYITVATYQSVYKGNPEDFEDIELAIADECHHVSADTFNSVMMVQLKNTVHRYGLTAFEERADNSTVLIESAVGPVIFKYDAPEAIADGFLAKPTFVIYDVYKTKGEWTKYKINPRTNKREAVSVEKSTEYTGDDDMIAYRNWVLGNDYLNDFVANITASFNSDGKSVLILVDEKEHGDRLMQLIPDAGFCVGGGADNEELQKKFNERKLKTLIGTSTLGEGADTVPVDLLICLQGGASKSKTLQAIGRALRNDPDPDTHIPRKPTALVIDFNFPLCGILSRHLEKRKEIMSTMGDVYSETL